MLKQACLENFVGFKDRQIIDFTNNGGPFILVGENGSGKSSVLEGVRRCLTSTRSTTRSSVYDKEKLAFFICKYDTSKCLEDILKEGKNMYTGVVTKNVQTYCKFISTERELLVDTYENWSEQQMFKCTEPAFTERVFKGLQSPKKDPDYRSIIDDIIENRQSLVVNTSNKEHSSDVEERLKMLEKYVVMTLPLRSIGPLQWSKSERIIAEKRDENYLEASRRSEIITYFLENKTEFDTDKEQNIFRDLTGHGDIVFRLLSTTNEEIKRIVVESTKTRLPGGEFALLKLPEGILESKHFSVLMSSNYFQTIVLEEPGRGMHPQMIERMLAIIRKENNNKLVVLTSHNPYFVNLQTISRLFIFRPIKSNATGGDTGAIDHSVIISGNEIAEQMDKMSNRFPPSMKILRLLTRDHFAELIFAKRILFCEGDSDFLFLTELKEKILKASPGIVDILKVINDTEIVSLDTLQRICVSIQIISMDGWNNAHYMHNLCTYLKLDDHYFVCDKDAILHDRDNASKYKNTKWWSERPYWKIVNNKDDWETIRERLRKDCKCFVWRDGTIEDMVMSLLRSETTTSDTKSDNFDQKVFWFEKKNVIHELKNQHVCLPLGHWKEKRQDFGRVKRRSLSGSDAEKLFLSPDVTQRNISNSTDTILNACDRRDDDLVQFVIFISEMENGIGTL